MRYDALHQQSVVALEQQFHDDNFGPKENMYLSVRTAGMERIDHSCTGTAEELAKDAQRFCSAYNNDVQFVFSRVQHHWHKLHKDGHRVPMQYCAVKGRRSNTCCKRGFPKKVITDAHKKLVLHKYRPRIVLCRGCWRVGFEDHWTT